MSARFRRLVVLAVAVVTVLGALQGSRSRPSGAYDSLLPRVLADSPDPIFGLAPEGLVMTESLILSSSVAARDWQTANEAASWLVDQLLPGGWSLPVTSDPYADGSLTAAGTPYSILTALAIDALLDYGVNSFDARRIADALMTWARDGWSHGYYWYSLEPADAIYTPNVTAMLAGVTARFISEEGDVLTRRERALLEERVAASFERLGRGDAGELTWRYSAFHQVVNDLNHQGYVLWGGELAREAGFQVPWTRAEAIDSINRFDVIYPVDVVHNPSTAGRYGSIWQVSGTGSALAFMARFGGETRGWERKACVALAQVPTVPRFAAHTLLGFAIAGMCDCPGHPAPRAANDRGC